MFVDQFQVRDWHLERGIERAKKYPNTPVSIPSIMVEIVNGYYSNISLEQVCSNVSNGGGGGRTLRVRAEKKISVFLCHAAQS